MTTEPDPQQKTRRRRMVFIAAAGAAVVLAGIYGIAGTLRNHGDEVCRPALAQAGRMAPFVKGEVAAVQVASEARLLPALTFTDATGAKRSLADWHGRTVLLNLWATWCVPCRQEMPALAALERKLGGKDFEVVAVNIDTRDLDKPKTWLKQYGIESLAYYSDPSAKVFQDLKLIGKAFGMPTTLIVDPSGCELAVLAGPAEWSSEDAVKLVQAALGK
ncbi:MAG: thiol:disulfide interchange protein TlpA [Xanthobacteraceae bacterium]